METRELKWFYGINALVIAIACYAIAKEFYWIALLPAILVLLYTALFKLDTFLLAIVAFTPLALQYELPGGLGLSVPTEPLIAGLMFLFILKLLAEKTFDRSVLLHPLSIALIANLIWMFFTSLTSTMISVSLKHFTARLWFIMVFYFLATQVFRNFKNIRIFVWCYTVSLVVVVFYTIINHAMHGFDQKSGHWVMWPFYNDHTAYAAALAMFIPILIAFARDPLYSVRSRWLSFSVLLLFIVAIILSYTRAAWISLLAALAVYVIFLLKIKFRTVFVVAAIGLTLFFKFQTDIFIDLKKNNQQSATDFNKHLQSISNITTDASNMERINRWNSALRMWREKPFWGWGPGTYQFQYAPYQLSKEMTIISTNAGTQGAAHSEYIGPLAESGVLGALLVIVMLAVMIYKATLLYSQTKNREIKMLTMGILLGLITYFTHGVLNSFLETDKAAVPVFGFMAILTALELYHKDRDESMAQG